MLNYNEEDFNKSTEALKEYFVSIKKKVKHVWFNRCAKCSGYIPQINGIISLKDSYKRITVNQCYDTKHISCYADIDKDFYTSSEKALYKFRIAYKALLASLYIDEDLVEDFDLKGISKDIETRKIIEYLMLKEIGEVINVDFFDEKKDELNKHLGYSLTQNVVYHHENGVMPSINKTIKELNWLKLVKSYVLFGKTENIRLMPRYDQLPQEEK